jgi:hypothetical protein
MKTNNALLFKRLSSETEEILLESLDTLKGGGNSDGIDLEEVEIVGEAPDKEDEEEEEEDPHDDEEPWDEWDEDGGMGPNNDETEEEDEEEEEDHCQKAKAAGQGAAAILNNSNVVGSIGEALQYGVEASFSIRESADGDLSSSDVIFGSGSNVPSQNYGDSIAAVHTHRSNGTPPSAADVISMAQSATGGSPDLEYSIVICQDGTRYAMVINDRDALDSFLTDNVNNVDQNNAWLDNSPVGAMFDVANAAFQNQGMNAVDAYTHASAYIMDRAGITLLKAEPTQTPNLPADFKKVNATSTVDSNGNEHFDATACP